MQDGEPGNMGLTAVEGLWQGGAVNGGAVFVSVERRVLGLVCEVVLFSQKREGHRASSRNG